MVEPANDFVAVSFMQSLWEMINSEHRAWWGIISSKPAGYWDDGLPKPSSQYPILSMEPDEAFETISLLQSL